MPSAMILKPEILLGKSSLPKGAAPLPKAAWYVMRDVNDGFECQFPAGTLTQFQWLTADFILDGKFSAKFNLRLAEGEKGPVFFLGFGLLNQCQARLRFKISFTDQHQAWLGRAGAWLKPLCWGERVDPAKVDRMQLVCLGKGEAPLRFCMTPLKLTNTPPAQLTRPLLLKGKLLDQLGQSTLHTWPGKSKNTAQVTTRLKKQKAEAPLQQWPGDFSRWGGWRTHKLDGTGFFRTHHDGKRWWLVDPDGHLYWSAGCNCVRVDTPAYCRDLKAAHPGKGGMNKNHINYLQANFERAFGPKNWYREWSNIALAQLKAFGFNTVANWSDWQIARAVGFPYVRPLHLRLSKTPRVFRDFPDVFHPNFTTEAAQYAQQLTETKNDPALLGYFLMNEPEWGGWGVPAQGMLLSGQTSFTRKALGEYIKKKYKNNAGLSSGWKLPVTLGEVEKGLWTKPVTQPCLADLTAFSTVMVEKLYATLATACKKVDPHHLNLGARFYSLPPDWLVDGTRCFDVFSFNCYKSKVARGMESLCRKLNVPALIGEWHFGSLDAGLPATGIGRVANQKDRGRAYRIYLEDAAAQNWCVGVHWFTLYDQSAMGRGDGENYNIGFLDVCNRPYAPLATAGRTSLECMYQIAAGQKKPFNKPPKYLTKVFY